MDREWFTLRLLQVDIAVLVMVVLVAITVITARLARDPSDSLVRWWQERGRAAVRVSHQPGGPPVPEATAASAAPLVSARESQLHTPEWLDRLIGRHPQDDSGDAGGSRVQQPVAAGRRVA